jgi:bifunctional UDP-N-acetylglucosamine pyrophosphorylase/glucosamine-1-phosphate N-acetyltransferase
MTSELFDLTRVPELLRPLLEVQKPWEILSRIDAFCHDITCAVAGDVHPTAVIEGNVYIAKTATVGPHAYIQGPCWVGDGAEVGHSALLRGGVILAPKSKVLHSSEVKRALFLPEAKAPHFNYVGDAIIGSRVNLGAGVKVANFKAFANEITVAGEKTGLRKFGAAIGDDVSIGCNAVLAPGTLIGARSVIYNGANIHGVIPADTVVKLRETLELSPRR